MVTDAQFFELILARTGLLVRAKDAGAVGAALAEQIASYGGSRARYFEALQSAALAKRRRNRGPKRRRNRKPKRR